MSNIEWTGKTWNPVSGCTRVSAGCDNCYAVSMSHRLGNMGQEKYQGLTVLNAHGDRHFNGVVRCYEDTLDIPLKRKKPTTWFVNSMSDLFHKEVPPLFIDRVFAVMRNCPQHTFQLLTKRAERMQDIESKCNRPLPNVWLGVSVEDGRQFNRIDNLRQTPAAIRFISYEPALEAIDIVSSQGVTAGWSPDWIIVGGESGAKARPFKLEWARKTIEQCRDRGVKVFVKQLGSNCWDGDKRVYYGSKGRNFDDWPEDLKVREMPEIDQ